MASEKSHFPCFTDLNVVGHAVLTAVFATSQKFLQAMINRLAFARVSRKRERITLIVSTQRSLRIGLKGHATALTITIVLNSAGCN
jgi:hypothetical protein